MASASAFEVIPGAAFQMFPQERLTQFGLKLIIEGLRIIIVDEQECTPRWEIAESFENKRMALARDEVPDVDGIDYSGSHGDNFPKVVKDQRSKHERIDWTQLLRLEMRY